MLAFKRSSLVAASEEQDNVLSRSSRVPHPKVNRLPSPPVYFSSGCARTHPHRSDQSGWSGVREEAHREPREAEHAEWLRKHRIITTPELEENRRVSRLPWAQSRSLVSLRILVFSFIVAPCCKRAAQNTRVIYRAKEDSLRGQLTVLSSLMEVPFSFLVVLPKQVLVELSSWSRVATIFEIPHVTIRARYSREDDVTRSTPCMCLRVTWTNWCSRQPNNREDIERGDRAFVLQKSTSLWRSHENSTCFVQCIRAVNQQL